MANRFLSEPKFDFAKNDFVISNGKFVLINGQELIKQKIEKVIRTEYNKYHVYDDVDYGVSLKSTIIGTALPLNYVKSEIERIVTEAVLKIDGVTNVSMFTVENDGSDVFVSFQVDTEFGSVSEEVEL